MAINQRVGDTDSLSDLTRTGANQKLLRSELVP